MKRTRRIILNAITLLSFLLCATATVLWIRSLDHIEGIGWRTGPERRFHQIFTDRGRLCYETIADDLVFQNADRPTAPADMRLIRIRILSRWAFSEIRPPEPSWQLSDFQKATADSTSGFRYARWGFAAEPAWRQWSINPPLLPSNTVYWDWKHDYDATGVHIDHMGLTVLTGTKAVPVWVDGLDLVRSTTAPRRARAIALAFPLLLTLVGAPFWLRATAYIYRAIRQRRRLAAGHCPNCGYDMRASPERCPECGTGKSQSDG